MANEPYRCWICSEVIDLNKEDHSDIIIAQSTSRTHTAHRACVSLYTEEQKEIKLKS